jgi:uncharacterized membrane protein YhaH (DUF805 family)
MSLSESEFLRDYLAEMAAELATLAIHADLLVLAYLFSMAALEARRLTDRLDGGSE